MKAVIPAAGMGTRLLPATKSMPKEMLPIVDKPVIQYVVEEAVASGIDEILIVTGRGKRAIEDHFDRSIELEQHLEARGRHEELEEVRRISDIASIHYIRQPEPLGLGHAVLCAESFVSDEPFAVLLGDDIVLDDVPATRQILETHQRSKGCVLSVMEVARADVSKYGIISHAPAAGFGEDVRRVTALVEKPRPEAAPSRLASIGRYVLTPDIFDRIRALREGHGGEIQLADALNVQAHETPVHARLCSGTRLDVGSVAGFLEANLLVAQRRGIELSAAAQRTAKPPLVRI